MSRPSLRGGRRSTRARREVVRLAVSLAGVLVLLAAGAIGFRLVAAHPRRHFASGPSTSSLAPTSTPPSSTAASSPLAQPSPSTPRTTHSAAPKASSRAPVALPASRSTSATAVPAHQPTPPIWLPFRATMKVGCVKSNCENNYHGYWAIDFETLDNKPGAPVYAAGAGWVHVSSSGPGTCGGPGTIANALIVDHGGGVQSVYVHLSDFSVTDGQWVTPTTVLGHVGTSGYTDPCPDNHLHFEVRVNGASVDPGELRACHGSTLVLYPQSVGYSSWNSVPAQENAGGPLSPKGRTVYSNGTSCS